MSCSSWKVRTGSAAALVSLLLAAAPATAQGRPPVGGGGGYNPPPVIASITAVQVANKKFRIYGTVTDNTPGTCGVVMSGAASGVVLCNALGQFDGVFDVPTLGAATAVAGDGQSSSQPSNLNLGNGPPTTTHSAVHGENGAITFSGQVMDEAPGGLVVTITGGPGLAGTSAIVLANGSWSVTVTLPLGSTGTATATVTDWYGLTGTRSTPY